MFSTSSFRQEGIMMAAIGYGAQITISEDDRYITVSAQIPQTYIEYNRNFRFWKWFFNETIRNFGATGWMYSCKFLSDWKPSVVIPLSWRERFLKFFGVKVDEKITPATGESMEAVVGFTISTNISTYKGIALQLSKTEFDKLNSLGLNCVEEVKGDTFPYRLRLGGNVLSAKLRK